ncbi:MAG TPA: carbohydrate ABC transporter permease [Thermotogota bacterium]|jgi:multiple sugar transport system permease protein|nr:carbohydrate ABC transporter permease [Thermotogota bacterium]NLZ14624.1 carbohydrate ABC transporter permease [Thermotogaceae bacterium]MDD8040631.1 carbohydrate ABC transporter permease [Thermotogota bacterium]MDD8052699.1 carbohydrate ABC transporter permease [Thermotogota bacterium]HNR63098.1 carbohydrate ABC transporter permease [Thermotogota bacterium]
MSRTDYPWKRTARSLRGIIFDVILLMILIVVLVPLVFMISASFMESKEVLTMPYRWIPSAFHWENYAQAIQGNDQKYYYARNIFNSLLVAITVTLSNCLFAAMTGFGLAKYRFFGRKIVLLLVMATMMIPFETIMIPLYMLVNNFGWQDSYMGLIMPFLVNAFGIFMMRQYLLTFPEDLLDAARIDGLNELAIFIRVVIPNSIPAMTALGILTFRSQWDSMLWPLLITQSEEMKTIPLYIVKFTTEKYTNEGALMAAAVIASIPLFIVFFSLAKYFIQSSSVFSGSKG